MRYWEEDCRVRCTIRISLADIPGDVSQDGDVFTVSIRRPGHATKDSLREAAQYHVYNAGCPDECRSYNSDHSDDPPWTLE